LAQLARRGTSSSDQFVVIWRIGVIHHCVRDRIGHVDDRLLLVAPREYCDAQDLRGDRPRHLGAGCFDKVWRGKYKNLRLLRVVGHTHIQRTVELQ
jgi:hypothetical protein